MKQTAVEWLVNIVQSCIAPNYIPKEIIKQAKEMEKQQIFDAHENGHNYYDVNSISKEKYYNETFKKK